MNKSTVFLIKFFAVFGLLQGIIWIAPLEPLNEWIAGLEASAFSLETEGNNIIGENAYYTITNSCTGLVSGSILAAIVFALKKPSLKKKISVFLLGAITLFLVNLVRVYFVVLVGVNFGFGYAELFHIASWFLMSGLIILLWYYLTKKWAGIKDFSHLL